MSEVIARFHMGCGRMGDVDGVFITSKESIAKAVGKTAYFGEILGKHSDVYCDIEEDSIKVLTDDQEFIAKAKEIFGKTDISGYNPLSYIEEADEDDEE